MSPITLCFTIADREGYLREKLSVLMPEVIKLFRGAAALVTSDTHQEIVETLTGLKVKMARAPSNFNHIGMHRRKSLEVGLEATASNCYLYIDIDHLLRWFENDRPELEAVLNQLPNSDLTVIGRGPKAFEALPARLLTTEAIINRIYCLVTGKDWDLLMAARGVSRRAAELIINSSTIDHIGNDLDWPLLCRSKNLTLGYEAANGLTYMTNLDYAKDVDDELDADPAAWAMRVEIAALHVAAIRPYL
ncbi:MAG: hypothetical protein JKY88_15130 [Pseudomonadales bacterium]|nr:hypothetical protein [Pseudomonadales bacterium]